MTALTPHQQQQLFLCKLTWLLNLAIALVDAAWIWHGGWDIDLRYLGQAWVLLPLLPLMWYVRRQENGFPAFLFVNTLLQIIVLSVTNLLLNYLVASMGRPLVDDQLVAMDAALGFSWLGFMHWLNGQPMLARILSISYDSMAPQIMVLPLLLCIWRKMDHLVQYPFIFTVSLVLTLSFAGLWPALAGFIHYDINLAVDFPNLHPAAAFLHQTDVEHLRSGTFGAMGSNTRGLVTFPSFHATAGLVLIYLFWTIKPLRWPALALNCALIFSVIGDGGHYLVDLLGGLAIGAFAIWLARKILPVQEESVSPAA